MHLRKAISTALALALVSAPAWSDDFDPHGRHRHPPPPPKHTPAPPGAAAPPPAAVPPSAALIERYTRIVLAQPGAAFPLQRLAQLYRDRDGSLKDLATDIERRASTPGPDQYAATIALAGIAKLDGRTDEAIAAYRRAIELRPNDPVGILALAHALQDRADPTARAEFDRALALQTAPADREQTLRTLMTLALDAKDYEDAKKWHEILVGMHSISLLVRGELARELYARGEYERAETEFTQLVDAARGDNRALAPALKDLGKTLAREHKNGEAVATLKRALAVAGAEAGVRGEVYEAITEIYRADQRLPEWVTTLEAEHPGDFLRLALLASLYEETGDAAKALATYRRALAVNPRQIDLRLRMIRLLESQGELDRAIAEYDGLIRAAPNDPQFVFEECEALLQRGDRARALKLLTDLEARAGGDEDVLARVADFYQRIGEGERSVKVLARLAQTGGSDPTHLVDLGDRYFQDGNTALALQTWKRILTVVQPRAKALSVLGDVYLEHDMPSDALAALREAASLDKENTGIRKQLAVALERVRSYHEANAVWQELAAKAKQSGDKMLAREARSQIVTLWGLQRMLEAQVAPLTRAISASPPDLDAARTLAEVQLHLHRLADAEATLHRVIDLAPGDADAYLALERVLVQENKLDQATQVLEKLVAVEPKRARELYQRMAQYALQTYKDEDAVRYAQRAVELNPDDAEGHRRLAEMYRSRQESGRAITEFRAAIQKNERLYPVYGELAELLLARGESAEADRLYRRVIRGAPDDELVARAARLSMQINLGGGTLESLEQDLLPLAIGNPQRPLYRRLLVEIYGSMTFGLVQRVSRGSGKDAEEARAVLARVGSRAVKPLLDALTDADASQQRIAIDVLGYVENRNAAPALFAFATGAADTSLRVRAMVACGMLRDADLLPKYEALLTGEDTPSDNVAVAAVWGVSRMEDKRASRLLRTIAKRGTPEMRALAVLGLGALRDKGAAREVAGLAMESGAGTTARAAAAYVLGEIGSEEDRATLLSLAHGTDALARQMALVALSRLPGSSQSIEEEASVAALADALFVGGEPESARDLAASAAIRRAGASALMTMARGTRSATAAHDTVPTALAAGDAIDVNAVLAQLVPDGFTADERAATLTKFEKPIAKAAATALTSPNGARAVVEALGSADGSLEPFVGPDSPDGPAREAARRIAREIEPRLASCALTPEVVVLLTRSANPAAEAAVVRALSESNDLVQRTALAAVGAQADREAVAQVSRILLTHESWALRVLAAQAMGRLGGSGARAAAQSVLLQAAVHDPYALVREAALEALASFDGDGARTLAHGMAGADPEPRVRATARRIASNP